MKKKKELNRTEAKVAFALHLVYDPARPDVVPLNVLPLGDSANIFDVQHALRIAYESITRQIGALQAPQMQTENESCAKPNANN